MLRGPMAEAASARGHWGADLTKAIELGPPRPNDYLLRGTAWIRKGEPEKAIADFSEVIRLEPERTRGRAFRAAVYYFQGSVGAAVEDYNAALRLEPNGAALYRARGMCRIWQADADQALADFGRALEIDPSNAYGHQARAWAWLLKGNVQQALADLDAAERLNPLDALTYLERGNVRAVVGQRQKAIAGWLAANEKPLALVVEATRRPRRYDPLIAPRELAGTGAHTAAGVTLGWLGRDRDLGGAMVSRAMLRLQQGKLEAAWSDILACQRLARLRGQGPTVVDALTAISLDAEACSAGAALARHGGLTVQQARQFRADLERLPPMPEITGTLDGAERYVLLDAIGRTARGGPGVLLDVFDWVQYLNGQEEYPELAKKLGRRRVPWTYNVSVDWDEVLRAGNARYDRALAACRLPDRARRVAAIGQLAEQSHQAAQRSRVFGNPLVSVPFGSGMISQQLTSQPMAEIALAVLVPDVRAMMAAGDRAKTRVELARLAFALAGYRAEHGEYPEALAPLAPKHIGEVPKDMFTDKDFLYRREADRYRLYSVGPNAKDDGGRGRRSAPDSKTDDVSLGSPLDK